MNWVYDSLTGLNSTALNSEPGFEELLMNLKMKRYHPLLIALLMIVTVLPLLMGNQRIVSYTLQDDFLVAAGTQVTGAAATSSGTPLISSEISVPASSQILAPDEKSPSLAIISLPASENQ
jgi:hypothetical protein